MNLGYLRIDSVIVGQERLLSFFYPGETIESPHSIVAQWVPILRVDCAGNGGSAVPNRYNWLGRWQYHADVL
jgi:hypothetical protein